MMFPVVTDDGDRWRRLDWALCGAAAAWALAWRLALLATSGRHPFFLTPIMDMAFHDEWARRIAAGDFWGTGPFFRAPLYPYFLGLAYKLNGGSILGARVGQAFVGAGGAALCYVAGREFFDRRVGVVAAFALGALWTAIYNDVELLLVCLEIPLGLTVLWTVARATKRHTLAWSAGAGAAVGLAAITRPNFLVVGAALVGAFFVTPAASGVARRRLFGCVAAYVAAAGCIVGAVAVRNYVVGGDAVLISWQGGVNLWIGNNPRSDGMTAVAPGTAGDWWRGYYDVIRRAEEAAGRKLRPSEVDHYYVARAAAFARADPGAAARLALWKLYVLTNAYEVPNNFDENYLRRLFPVLAVAPVSLYIILPLGLFGAAVNIRRWRRLAPLYLYVVAYAATVVLFFVNARFRMPLVAPLAIFAAAAFFAWRDSARRWGRAGVAGRAVALAALFVYCGADPFHLAGRATAQARYTVGTIYLERGELDAARREFEAALATPNLPPFVAADAWNDLGVVAARRGDFAGAENCWRREIQLAPGATKGWNNLGNLAATRRDIAAARSFYARALAADPADSRAHYFYGRLLWREGDRAGARAAFARAVYYTPNFAAAWLELGRLAWLDGDGPRARTYFARAADAAPADAAAREALATVEFKLGDYAAAARDYERAVKLAESARVRYNLACALARAGRPEEARRHLARAIALEPRYAAWARGDADLAGVR